MSEIEHVVVVGAGTMGSGIAQTAAVSGYRVTMTDVDDEAITRGRTSIQTSVEKLTEKGILSQEQRAQALLSGQRSRVFAKERISWTELVWLPFYVCELRCLRALGWVRSIVDPTSKTWMVPPSCRRR